MIFDSQPSLAPGEYAMPRRGEKRLLDGTKVFGTPLSPTYTRLGKAWVKTCDCSPEGTWESGGISRTNIHPIPADAEVDSQAVRARQLSCTKPPGNDGGGNTPASLAWL